MIWDAFSNRRGYKRKKKQDSTLATSLLEARQFHADSQLGAKMLNYIYYFCLDELAIVDLSVPPVIAIRCMQIRTQT